MKKLTLLFLVLPVFASAQIVNIPDANFKAALVANLSINTNADGEIQVSEAIVADSIDVFQSFISDLTGIEAFTALVYLDCGNNWTLTSLDVSQNVALLELDCSFSQLTALDISQNTVLTKLICNNSLITNLDVSSNTALTTLWCWSNSLTSLDVSNNTELTSLRCSYNDLTSLNVSNNTALTYLSCGSNSLTSLDVSNNIALIEFDCGNNMLTNLDVTNNVALVEFFCHQNQLTNLDVSQQTGLVVFFCDDNQLNQLDVRNGNNVNMSDFSAISNSGLTCIQVDDSAWATANWSSDKDSTATFSNDCTVGIKDNQTSQPTITSYNNTITIKGKGTATIFNLTGQRVHHTKLTGNTSISLDKGIYLVRVSASGGEGRSVTEKVYLQ